MNGRFTLRSAPPAHIERHTNPSEAKTVHLYPATTALIASGANPCVRESHQPSSGDKILPVAGTIDARLVLTTQIAMNILASILLVLVCLGWGWDTRQADLPTGAHFLRSAPQQGLYVSGPLSAAMMCLVMLLAARPVRLDAPGRGLEVPLLTHKWAGILAHIFVALDGLIEISSDIVKFAIGREDHLPRERIVGFLQLARDGAKYMGDWAIYGVLVVSARIFWTKLGRSGGLWSGIGLPGLTS